MKVKFSILGKDLLTASVKSKKHGLVTGAGKSVDEAYKDLLYNLELLDVEDNGIYKDVKM